MKKFSQRVALATLALLVAGIIFLFVQQTRDTFAGYQEQIPAAVTENPN